MRLMPLALAIVIALSSGGSAVAAISVDLKPAAANPATPQMGDHLSFHTVIRNNGTTPVDGLIAWISLVQTDRGKVQPIDLEDWSAHKAVTAATLAPGQVLRTEWPMRLIQPGHYRVVVSATSRDGTSLAASRFAEFTVRQKPVVESRRVLPVAFGLPLLVGTAMFWRWRRG